MSEHKLKHIMKPEDIRALLKALAQALNSDHASIIIFDKGQASLFSNMCPNCLLGHLEQMLNEIDEAMLPDIPELPDLFNFKPKKKERMVN